MTLTKQLEPIIKDTLGYVESENKEDFYNGANVGIAKAEDFFKKENQKLKTTLEHYKSYSEELYNELKTVSSIIKRYSDND